MEWRPASEVPDCELFAVYSTRNDDDAEGEGIHQFRGVWMVKPITPVTRDLWERWCRSHCVTLWLPLPAIPSE